MEVCDGYNREERREERLLEVLRQPMFEQFRPYLDGAHFSIVRLTIQANQFEIKPAIIQMMCSLGAEHWMIPNTHIENFLEICDTFKHNEISDDSIRLCLFPFSLRDRAKSWLNCLPVGSIDTWEDLAKAFLTEYFPPSKTMKLRADITTFA